MSIILVTGSAGLVGSESVSFFSKKKFKIIGIDNNFRKYFFGINGSTLDRRNDLIKKYNNYTHFDIDIRNYIELEKIFKKYKNNISCIIHSAAQPSHDWSAKEPITDFSINAFGTINLLELTKKYSRDAVFIFTSTNKVYGDNPNKIKLIEKKNRYEVMNKNFFNGVNETMSLDNSIHSIFGVSKVSADLLVQEYGKNFLLKTGVFRGGCITGSNQSGAELHGFLNYLVRANINKVKYFIYGYKGKQVRDNIHSLDLVNSFWQFFKKPLYGEVFNIGGGRVNSCSILEAIEIIEEITHIKMKFSILKKFRVGDHKWYISNNSKFIKKYNNWNLQLSLKDIIYEIVSKNIFYKKRN
jgi:CDP-paratose 2-epimerase